MTKIIYAVSCDRNNWRLKGQDEYLDNKTLVKINFVVKDPAWDHEHCEFCTQCCESLMICAG